MRRVALAATIGLTACVVRVGNGLAEFEPTYRVEGVSGAVGLPARQVQGELLELRDTAIVMLAENRVVLIPNRVIVLVSFPSIRDANGWPLRAAARDQLRLVSRFPYGMPPEAAQRLLQAKGQDSIAVVTQ